MNDAADYVIYIKTFLISEPAIVDLKIVREETQGKIGLYRFRLSLANGDLLEIFERFSVESERVEVTKYSFQWQDDQGVLRRRWDNAPHHPELVTHPDHVHEGAEAQPQPHLPVTAIDILQEIIAMIKET